MCPAAAVMPPLECQAGEGIQQTVTPDTNPLWQAVKAFQAGETGALPLSTEWSAQENSQTCTPECKYGTCLKVCPSSLTAGCRGFSSPISAWGGSSVVQKFFIMLLYHSQASLAAHRVPACPKQSSNLTPPCNPLLTCTALLLCAPLAPPAAMHAAPRQSGHMLVLGRLCRH